MFGLNCPDLDVGIFRLKDFSYSRDGPACAYAGAETVDGTVDLIKDLDTCLLLVNGRICGILELLRNEDVRIFSLHPESRLQALFDACTDVAGIVDQDDLSTVMFNKLLTLFAYRVRHDDDSLIASDCADEREADTLVAAGRLNDNGVLVDEAFLLDFV